MSGVTKPIFSDDTAKEIRDAINSVSDVMGAKSVLKNFKTSVATLESESKATVDYSNGMFLFGIPKGVKGDKGDTSYDAKTAEKLKTARNIRVDLTSALEAPFDGSANIVPGVTGILPVANGGTGMSASPSLLVNLNSASPSNVMQASPRPGVTGILPVAYGGTGASDAATARTNLGITPNNISAMPIHPHYIEMADGYGYIDFHFVEGVDYTSRIIEDANGRLQVNCVSFKDGEISNATWSGSAIGVANGGTGATDAATACSNIGAVKKSGDTMTGRLYMHNQSGIKSADAWPSIAFYDENANNRGAIMLSNLNTWHVNVKETGASYSDRYRLPNPTANKTADTWYDILTSKSPVTIAQGGTGAKTAEEARAALGAQATLGFTPVQNGGGAAQSSNKVYIGWAVDASGLKAQVDSVDMGYLATIGDNANRSIIYSSSEPVGIGAKAGKIWLKPV